MANELVKKILVVDDEPSNLNAVRRIINDTEEFDNAIEAAYVESGAAALEMVASFHPDVILLDIVMPGMSGYEVCQKIKSDPKTKEIMILLLSGKASVDDRLQGYAVQADDYITKPYDRHELLAKIRILLRLRSALANLRTHNESLTELVHQRTKELLEKEKQAIIGQMVQGIVHNLRGPLTGIKGFNELAQSIARDQTGKEATADDEIHDGIAKINEYLGYSHDSIKRLEELISNLLVKGRNEASTERVVLDLNEVLRAELNFLQADMHFKHKVTKMVDLAEELPLVMGCYSDFSQIFCNLVQNAVDAMFDEDVQELVIRSSEEKGCIRIDFEDTGTGIKTEDVSRVFEPFFTTKAKKGEELKKVLKRPVGTGLGLYTCAEILKSYGGKITVASSAEKGSCFTVIVPIESVEQQQSGE